MTRCPSHDAARLRVQNRHARRAVTRSLLKRQITRPAVAMRSDGAGLWLFACGPRVDSLPVVSALAALRAVAGAVGSQFRLPADRRLLTESSGPLRPAAGRLLIARCASTADAQPWLGNACRFEPTCSVYSIDALRRHGALAGSALTLGRIGRCHPWCAGGHDPVPALPPRLFRALLSRAPAPRSPSASGASDTASS